jgi:hypothetical protein
LRLSLGVLCALVSPGLALVSGCVAAGPVSSARPGPGSQPPIVGRASDAFIGSVPDGGGACAQRCSQLSMEHDCVEVLASRKNSGDGPITLHRDRVIWGDFHEVRSVGTCGGADEVVVTSMRPVDSLVVDDQSVYWSSRGDGSIRSAPISGGEPITLFGGYTRIWSLALSGSWIYWTSAEGVFKGSREGGAPTTISSEQGQALAVDDGVVYWTDTLGVMRTPEGGQPRRIAGGGGPYLAVASHRVYWFSGSGTTCAHPVGVPRDWPCGPPTAVMSLDPVTGRAVALWPQVGIPSGLAVDDGDVYWVDGGHVSRVSTAGGSAEDLYLGGFASAVAARDGASYYTTSIGLVKVTRR